MKSAPPTREAQIGKFTEKLSQPKKRTLTFKLVPVRVIQSCGCSRYLASSEIVTSSSSTLHPHSLFVHTLLLLASYASSLFAQSIGLWGARMFSPPPQPPPPCQTRTWWFCLGAGLLDFVDVWRARASFTTAAQIE